MARPDLNKYPWHRTRAGESFFVPALDLQATMTEGMRAAKFCFGRVPRFQARPAVYKGMLGVMFKLVRLPPTGV